MLLNPTLTVTAIPGVESAVEDLEGPYALPKAPRNALQEQCPVSNGTEAATDRDMSVYRFAGTAMAVEQMAVLEICVWLSDPELRLRAIAWIVMLGGHCPAHGFSGS